MADFQLELDVFANTGKLEAGLKKAERAVSKTADAADKTIGKLGGFQAVAKTVGVAAAAVAGFETAVSLANAALGVMSGDAEKVRASLESLPIFGGLIARTFQFEEALHESSQRMRDLRFETMELDAALQKLEDRTSLLSENLSIQAQEMKLLGQSDLDIAIKQQDLKIRLLEQEAELEEAAIKKQGDARRKEIQEANVSEEQRRQLIEASRREIAEQLFLLSAQLQMKKNLIGLEIASLKSQEEAAALAEQEKQAADREAERIKQIADRQKELDRQAEEHQKQIMELEERARKKREEEAAAQKKAQEEQLAFVNARLKLEEEIAKARQEAEAQVAGATSTFATAGGSFTTAVSAQVNEAKLLTKISQQSRDFLAQIVQNTAMMAGGFSLA